jgi:hypothetical protein
MGASGNIALKLSKRLRRGDVESAFYSRETLEAIAHVNGRMNWEVL